MITDLVLKNKKKLICNSSMEYFIWYAGFFLSFFQRFFLSFSNIFFKVLFIMVHLRHFPWSIFLQEVLSDVSSKFRHFLFEFFLYLIHSAMLKYWEISPEFLSQIVFLKNIRDLENFNKMSPNCRRNFRRNPWQLWWTHSIGRVVGENPEEIPVKTSHVDLFKEFPMKLLKNSQRKS